MKYTSNFFDNFGGSYQEFTIDYKDIEDIKSLISSTDESSYYSPMLKWSFHDNKIESKNHFFKLGIAMQFISMVGEPSPNLVEKHQLNGSGKYKLMLLRSLYIDIADYSDDSYVGMAYKRPFGNSYPLGDVIDTLVRANVIQDYDSEETEDEIFQPYLNDFVDFLNEFFKDFTIKWTSFESDGRRLNREETLNKWKELGISYYGMAAHYLWDWKVSKSYMRDMKIDKVLDKI
jgi:hypothetical protein